MSFVIIRTDVASGRRFPLRIEPAPSSGPGRRELGEVRLRQPVRVPRDATIREAAEVMEEEQISSVLLGDNPAWLVSEHDLIGALAGGLDAGDPPARWRHEPRFGRRPPRRWPTRRR